MEDGTKLSLRNEIALRILVAKSSGLGALWEEHQRISIISESLQLADEFLVAINQEK